MSRKLTKEELIAKAIEIHEDYYDYSKVTHINSTTKVTIICPVHGEFEQTLNAHVNKKQGCKKCGLIKVKKKLTKSFSDYVKDFNVIHSNKYDYSLNKLNDYNSHDYIDIICKNHGVFKQKIYAHKTSGCPECSKIGAQKRQAKNTSEVIKDFINIHGNRYNYDKIVYYNTHTNVKIECKLHGYFLQTPLNHSHGSNCPKCSNTGTSKIEKSLIDAFDIDFIENDRTILDGKEIDLMYNNIGIEINGVYWHSTRFNKDKNYHLDKTKLAESKGIQLLHFWDYEIETKKELVMSMIKSKLNFIETKVYARKCIIKEVSTQDTKQFLNDNHLQGAGAIGKIRFGLYYNDELISIMTFSKPRFNKKYDYELIRFCNKTNTIVVGAASELFKHFRKMFSGSVISYANRRFSNGNLYETLGFTKIDETKPNYFYEFRGKYIYSRTQTQKHKLKKLLDDFDNNLTEVENMNNNNYYQVFDCGNLVYVMED